MLHLKQVTQAIEAFDANLSGSTFNDVNLASAVFTNVNMSGATITDANLSGVSITDANLTGASINGIPFADLLAAYLARKIRWAD